MRGRWLTPDTPGAGFICRVLRIPNSVQCQAIVNGALDDLQNSWNFEQYGDLTPEQTAALFEAMYEDYRRERGCMIGTIFAHACAAAPLGSLACDGASFLRADYPDLYDALDTAYHVDSTHGRTPDLRSRSVVGVGQGSGLSNRAIDGSGGEETHTLSTGEMPSHSHSFNQYQFLPVAAVGVVGAASAPTFPTNTGSAGGGGAHENMHPWRALHYAIWAR